MKWIIIIGSILILGAVAIVAFHFRKNKRSYNEIENVTFEWLKNKIKEKLAAKNAKKVALAKINELLQCASEDVLPLKELSLLVDDGYSLLIATVDTNGEVIDVEAIKCDSIDSEVEEFINKTGEGMVIIEE